MVWLEKGGLHRSEDERGLLESTVDEGIMKTELESVIRKNKQNVVKCSYLDSYLAISKIAEVVSI